MRRGGGHNGFILVSVLVALIVLTGLAASVAYLVRTTIVGAAAKRADLVSDALLASGLELAGYQLFMLRRPAEAMSGQRIRLNDGVVTLFAAPEAGKIDLNGAEPELLAAVWNSIGAPGLKPEAFAARVVDYRDKDAEVSKDGGAEGAQYAAAGIEEPPANAPFEQVDDLRKVLGVTSAATLALKPLLTVHNPGGKISVRGATPAVLSALPGGAALADRVLALRASLPPPDAAEPPAGRDERGGDEKLQQALGEQAKFFTTEPVSAAYTVRVEVERADARRAVEFVLTGSKTKEALYFVTDRVDRPTR